MRKRTLPPTRQILYNFGVEYPFPPVGIVGAADGKNRRAFLCLWTQDNIRQVISSRAAFRLTSAQALLLHFAIAVSEA